MTVVGNSIGGWVAAELALAAPDRVARLVIIDGAGLDSADHPMADFYSLTLDQVTELSWANPEGHRIDLSALTDAQRAIAGGNRAALAAYGGPSMADPTLAARLSGVTADTLVVWGEADRMMTPGYGKEYAAAIRARPSACCRARATCRSSRPRKRCSPCSRRPERRAVARGSSAGEPHRPGGRSAIACRQRANSVARDSRTTVTRIWPG